MCIDVYEYIYMHIYGFRASSAGKESTCNSRDSGLIPGLGRSPGEGIGYPLQYSWASLVPQTVKNPPAMQEIWVWSLGGEDPQRRAWQPTPVFLPGESPWTEEPGKLQSMGLQRVGYNWLIVPHIHTHITNNLHKSSSILIFWLHQAGS